MKRLSNHKGITKACGKVSDCTLDGEPKKPCTIASITVSVQDRRIGITKEDQAMLLEPCIQGGRTDLDLSFAKRYWNLYPFIFASTVKSPLEKLF